MSIPSSMLLADGGETGAAFLKLGSGARALSLGEAASTISFRC